MSQENGKSGSRDYSYISYDCIEAPSPAEGNSANLPEGIFKNKKFLDFNNKF